MPRLLARLALPITLTALALPALFARNAAGESIESLEQKAREVLEQRLERANRKLEQNPDARRWRFERARALHQIGAAGDEAAAKKALRLLESLHNHYPQSPRITAYYGAAVLLSADRQFFPWDKQDKLEEGQKLLNQAVEQADDPYEARLLRGIAGAHLPAMIGKQEQALKDLRFAVEHAKAKREAGVIDAQQAAAAHYHYATLLKKMDRPISEATRHWQQSVELAPASYAGLRAKIQLKRHGDTGE